MSTIEATNDALLDESLLPDICSAIVEGSTLVRFCAEHDPLLKYRIIVKWINDDEKRAMRYKLALDTREQHAKDLIIAELISWLSAKPVDAFVQVQTENGPSQAMLPIGEMPSDLQRLIAGYEFEEIFEMQGSGSERTKVHIGRLHKIKFYDKPRSVETFMKHLAMLVDRKEIKGTFSLADLITGGMTPPPV